VGEKGRRSELRCDAGEREEGNGHATAKSGRRKRKRNGKKPIRRFGR
jgi:hypothetical protein